MAHIQNLPASPPMSFLHETDYPGTSQLLDFNGDSTGNAVHEIQSTIGNGEGVMRSQNSKQNSEKRIMILCFDGTGNKFGEHSNIFRFFKALKKDDRKKQIVYYQAGLGTYNKRSFITRAMHYLSSMTDEAIAWHIDDHVKEGYQFIVQNYEPGDRICIFGFSRGAHMARVVAGMIYKVGILSKHSDIELVDSAFSIYSTNGYNGYKLSQEFKQTFAHQVTVDFVGVWDTVSSVGIIPELHPYSSVNYAVKKFRHALSLDERRARFRPNVWSNRDNFAYALQKGHFADVKEVWFAGTHADVGGGSHSATRSSSLSSISLRWMIKECILSETGIIFNLEYLQDDLDFDFGKRTTQCRVYHSPLFVIDVNWCQLTTILSSSVTGKLPRRIRTPE